MEKYKVQIEDLARFAIARGFNPETDDLADLAAAWIKSKKSFYEAENLKKVKIAVKQILDQQP